MATSSIPQEMLHYFMQLNEAEQQSVLQMLKTFVGTRKEVPGLVTLEEYNHELEQADAEIEAGNYVPHEEVTKRYFRK